MINNISNKCFVMISQCEMLNLLYIYIYIVNVKKCDWFSKVDSKVLV